ncbi:MAG: hypothetical protein KatS3mg003_1454 [Candidatus Nitrosocaldaceae archaeon]|nr:MAG: hypothetical protein KatS3mg003_1454 [Candidatus Nitrosocaldaceae archaeon]
MIWIIALALIQLLDQYIDTIIALLFIIIWIISFAIDSIYTYHNRMYIKDREMNIIMYYLYDKIPYPLIIAIILTIELIMIIGLAYLYTQSLNYNLKIENISLNMIVFAYIHIEAFLTSRRTIKRL